MEMNDWKKISNELLVEAKSMPNSEGIDKEILLIQGSTKTSIKTLSPIHDKLRMKYGWYYRWHLNPWSRATHTIALALYVATVSLFSVNLLVHQTKAGIDFAPQLAEKNINYSEIYKSVKPEATEVVTKRTENQKVFQNPDGTQQYIISGGPLHYKDKDNNYKNIDSAIFTKENNSGFVMDRSIYSADFNKEFASNPLVQIEKDNQSLSMTPKELSYSNGTENQAISTPQEASGQANDHKINYPNAYGQGLDFAYETQDFQLNKQLNITSLNSLPTPTIGEENTDLKLALEFGLSNGLELFIDNELWNGQETTIENKTIIFKKDGKTLWQLTPPKAWDASYDPNKTDANSHPELVSGSPDSPVIASEARQSIVSGKALISKTDNTLNIAVLIPYSWLKAASYPVTIDPDTYYGGATDGQIMGMNASYATTRSTSDSYNNNNTTIAVGQTYNGPAVGTGYGIWRGYLEFDTSGIVDTDVISQANLFLSAAYDYSTTDFNVEIRNLDWASPLGSINRESNYDGAIGASTLDAVWRSTSGITTNTSYASSNLVTSMIKKLAGEKTRYILISAKDSANSAPINDEYVVFNSQELASPTLSPYLSITIGPAAPNNCQSAATGNWSDASSWTSCGGTTPQAGDSVTILNGHTISLTSNTDIITGNLTIDTGATLNTYVGASSYNLSANDITVNGTLYAGTNGSVGTSVFTVSGSWNQSQGTFTRGRSTIVMNGTGTLTANAISYVDGQLIYNLTIDTEGTITLASSFWSFGGTITLQNGTLNGNGVHELAISRPQGTTAFVNNGVTYGTGGNLPVVAFYCSNGTTEGAPAYIPAANYPKLSIYASSVTTGYAELAGNITTSNDLWLTNNQTNGGVQLSTGANNYSINVGSNFNAGVPWSTSRGGKLKLNNATFTVTGSTYIHPSDHINWTNNITAGNATININGSWSNADTFTAGTSTVTFGATTAGKTINTGGTGAGKDFYNLTFNGTNGVWTTASAMVIANNLTITAGTFNPDIYNLTVTGDFSNSGNFGLDSPKPSAIITISGNWTNTAGTFYLSSNSIVGTSIKKNVTCSGGTVNATSNGHLTFDGAITSATVDFTGCTYLKGTGQFRFMRSGINAVTFSPSESDFGTVIVGGGPGSSVTLTVTSNLTLSKLTLGRVTAFDISNRTLTITGTGSVLTATTPASFVSAGSTVVYTGSAATTIGPVPYNNLTFTPVSAIATTYSLGGHLNAANSKAMTGNLTLNNGATLNTSLNYGIDCTNVTINSGSTLTANAATLTVSGNWTNNGGTFNNGTSTVIFIGNDAAINGTASSQLFTNIVVSKTAGQTLGVNGSTSSLVTAGNFTETTGNFAPPASFLVIGDITLSAGTFTAGDNIDVAGDWTNNGATFVHGNSTVTFRGGWVSEADHSTMKGSANTQTFNNLVIEKQANGGVLEGSLTVGISTLNANNITLLGGTFTAGETTNVAGNWTNTGGIFQLGGKATGSITYSNYPVDGDIVTISDGTNSVIVEYNTDGIFPENDGDVQFGSLSPQAFADAVNGYGIGIEATPFGSYTINFENKTFGTAGNIAITKGAGQSQPSTIDGMSGGAADSIVNFTKSSGTQTLDSGGTETGKSFNDLAHSGAGILQLTNSVSVDGNLSNSDGALDANGQNITVAGDFNVSGGNFNTSAAGNPGNQTVTFVGSGTSTIRGNNTFNKLEIDTANASAAKTVNFASGTTQAINSDLTLAGTSNKRLTLGRDGGSGTDQWTIDIANSFPSGQYVTTANSRVTGGIITPGSWEGANVVDGGNNTGWNFDTTGPTGSIVIDEGAFTKESAVHLTLSAADMQSGMSSGQMAFSNDASTYSPYEAYATTKDWELSSGNGTKTVYVKFKDTGSNESSPYDASIILDTASPVDFNISPAPASWTNQDIALSFSANDSHSGINHYEVKIDSGNYSTQTSPYTIQTSALSDSEHIATVKVVDNANNSTELPVSFFVDRTAPVTFVPQVHPAEYSNTNISLTFETTDQTSGLNRYEVKIDGEEYSTQTSPYTISIANLSDGDHTARVRSVDNANNTRESDAITFQVDKTAPTSFAVTSPEVDSSTTANSQTFSWGESTDATSGIDSYQFYMNGLLKQDDIAVNITSISDFDISNLSDGTHTWYVKAIDVAGNAKNSTLGRFILDRTGPIFSDSNIPITNTPTNNLDVTFNWNAPEDISSITEYVLSIGSTLGGDDIQKDKTTTQASWNETFVAAGTYYIKVKAKDSLNNWGEYSEAGSVVIDQDPPTISITNIPNDEFVNTKSFTVLGTSADAGAGVKIVELQLDGGDWSKVETSDRYATWHYNWEDYSDGLHTIVARSIGKAGNVAATVQYVFKVDATTPSLPADFRVFNVSNTSANVYATYLDFAGSTDETSGLKNYEVYRNGVSISEIGINKDISNPRFTGNQNQSYYLIDQDLNSAEYIYKIRAIDLAGNASETSEISLDTAGKAIETDLISDLAGLPSTVVTKDKTSAIVSWKTVHPATSFVEYGETTSYGQKSEFDLNLNQGHSILLQNLKPQTAYHAKVTSKDIYGKELTSEDISFTTKAPPEDKSAITVIVETLQNLFRVLTVGAAPTSALNETEMTLLQGFSNNLMVTDVSFKEKNLYQNILTYPKDGKIARGTDGKSFSAVTSATQGYYLDKDLNAASTYYYRNEDGLPVVRKPIIGDDSPLEISDATVTKESVLTSKDKVQLTVSWKTNRGAGSLVEFGTTTTYGQKTKEDASLNMGHNVVLEGLSPNTTYHFKVYSKDAKGQLATSGDFTFQTPVAQKTKTPLDVITESFQRLLGSFKNIFS